MSDADLIVDALRNREPCYPMRDLEIRAADLIERQAARIAELEKDAAKWRSLGSCGYLVGYESFHPCGDGDVALPAGARMVYCFTDDDAERGAQ